MKKPTKFCIIDHIKKGYLLYDGKTSFMYKDNDSIQINKKTIFSAIEEWLSYDAKNSYTVSCEKFEGEIYHVYNFQLAETIINSL